MTKSELASQIRALGLGGGDTVVLHSSLGSIGEVDGGAETVVDAFLDVLGEKGTLVVPTFGGGGGGGGGDVFDPATTPAGLGAITEAVRMHPDAARSLHPMASVAAVGARAAELVRDHEKAPTAHAEGTPYTRIAELGGYVLLLGVDQDRNTTLHTAEALCKLPYLSTRTKKYLDPAGAEHEGTWDFFPGPHRDFIGMDRALREGGVVKLGKVGAAVARLMKSRELIDAAARMIEADPAACLCDNPSCDDCVKQRAAFTAPLPAPRPLRAADAHTLAAEGFRLVASSSLAGGDAEEFIAGLAASGVAAVELDLAAIDDDDLKALASKLSAAGVAVASLACVPLTVTIDRALAACKTLGAEKLVLPLEDGLEDALAAAAAGGARGVKVLLRNGAVKGERAAELLSGCVESCGDVGLSFDPSGFVLGGEKPFSESLKMKGRRRLRQLVVTDVTADGAAVALGRGRCEIKELISILRCRSYDGDMLLGPPGELKAAADGFARMVGGL